MKQFRTEPEKLVPKTLPLSPIIKLLENSHDFSYG